MNSQFLGKMAIGAAAFGASAAAVLILAVTNGPSLEAKLGVLGVELSVSIGDAPAVAVPAYLEASLMRRTPNNRVSGVDLRVAKSGGLYAPASVPAETPVSRATAATPVPVPPCNT
jgi:hypothetical protein